MKRIKRTKKLRLGIDCDGVIRNLHDWCVNTFNYDKDKRIFYHWNDLIDNFPGTKEDFKNHVYNGEKSFSSIKAPLESVYTKQDLKLLKTKFDLILISHQHGKIMHTALILWLYNNNLYDLFSEIHICKEKYHVKCDAYVDDSPYNVKDLYINTNKTIFIYNQTWNFYPHVYEESIYDFLIDYQHEEMPRIKRIFRLADVMNYV